MKPLVYKKINELKACFVIGDERQAVLLLHELQEYNLMPAVKVSKCIGKEDFFGFLYGWALQAHVVPPMVAL